VLFNSGLATTKLAIGEEKTVGEGIARAEMVRYMVASQRTIPSPVQAGNDHIVYDASVRERPARLPGWSFLDRLVAHLGARRDIDGGAAAFSSDKETTRLAFAVDGPDSRSLSVVRPGDVICPCPVSQ
jgi:hypothetical protein